MGWSLELKLRILEIQPHVRGKIYKISADGKTVSIVLTFHALERMQRWKLTERQAIRALFAPEEVLKGHRNRYIAHRSHFSKGEGDYLVIQEKLFKGMDLEQIYKKAKDIIESNSPVASLPLNDYRCLPRFWNSENVEAGMLEMPRQKITLILTF